MARKSPVVPAPTLGPRRALLILEKQLASGIALAQSGVPDSAYSSWSSETRHWIDKTFGEASRESHEFHSAGSPGPVMTDDIGPAELAAIRRNGLNSQLNKLRAHTSLLRVTCESEKPATSLSPPRTPGPGASRTVFVVHGRDDAAKQHVARVIEKLGLTAVILHEQTTGGRALIEQFEGRSEGAAFAVALLTADDVGHPKALTAPARPRARQNVVFEAGYFMGRLGRANVALLVAPGVERPSDLEGIVYIEMDAHEGWATKLAKEMGAAGLDVVFNRP